MRARFAIVAVVFASGPALAQTNQGPAPSAEVPQAAAETPAHAWSVSAMIYGYKVSLGYRKLTLYSEGEYVIDAGNSADNFFYTWSELTYAPVEAFRFGLVIQRTKAYQTRFEIQRGLLAGFSAKLVEFTTYVFNFDGDPAVVLAAAISFDL